MPEDTCNENRRKYEFSDVLHEISRVKGLVDSGFFGELDYEQLGKLHKELWLIESAMRGYQTDRIMGSREYPVGQGAVVGIDTLAEIAVSHIIADLTDRRGLGQEWDQIDEEVQDEITEKWQGIVKQAIAGR